VVLFDYDVPSKTPVRNIQSAEQVRALIAGLQAAATIPLLVAVDQEGGSVARLKEAHGFPPTVSARALGAANDLDRTRDAAGRMAQTLRELGFNLNFAPVVDLDINPENPIIGKIERSFSPDPAIVTAHAAAFIGAHHEHGVLCTLKHFPGHGSSAADSHLGLVDVSATWSPVELEPYTALIKAGAADAIMTAHVFNSRLDPNNPATLSRPVLTGILRDQLGFDGVVICDDIQMGAIREHYGFETAIEQAVLAGVDMITIANNTVYEAGIAGRAFAALKQAVQAGRIDEARIDDAYRRVQDLKGRVQALA
jgi:beta-N-acetylhexosaminidase